MLIDIIKKNFFITSFYFMACIFFSIMANATTLKEIQKRGELRHIGVLYSNFITGLGDGFSVELIKGFAKELGVKYKFVITSWTNVIEDLSGKKFKLSNGKVSIIDEVPVKGDLISCALTKLKWIENLISYSDTVFPAQTWLIARADSKLRPIKPTNNEDNDIKAVKIQLVKGVTIAGKKRTTLDGKLYNIEQYGAKIVYFNGMLSELIPYILNNNADATLYDANDALIALVKWPGKIKIIGPVSKRQELAVAFTKDAEELKKRFNSYLKKIKQNGIYYKLVKKYYPLVFKYFPDFFKNK